MTFVFNEKGKQFEVDVTNISLVDMMDNEELEEKISKFAKNSLKALGDNASEVVKLEYIDEVTEIAKQPDIDIKEVTEQLDIKETTPAAITSDDYRAEQILKCFKLLDQVKEILLSL